MVLPLANNGETTSKTTSQVISFTTVQSSRNKRTEKTSRKEAQYNVWCEGVEVAAAAAGGGVKTLKTQKKKKYNFHIFFYTLPYPTLSYFFFFLHFPPSHFFLLKKSNTTPIFRSLFLKMFPPPSQYFGV